jgi:hypothetical protein
MGSIGKPESLEARYTNWRKWLVNPASFISEKSSEVID